MANCGFYSIMYRITSGPGGTGTTLGYTEPEIAFYENAPISLTTTPYEGGSKVLLVLSGPTAIRGEAKTQLAYGGGPQTCIPTGYGDSDNGSGGNGGEDSGSGSPSDSPSSSHSSSSGSASVSVSESTSGSGSESASLSGSDAWPESVFGYSAAGSFLGQSYEWSDATTRWEGTIYGSYVVLDSGGTATLHDVDDALMATRAGVNHDTPAGTFSAEPLYWFYNEESPWDYIVA